ncbi:MAG: hypothetical protein II705_01080 [Clostridia bacterium]|nr:hypothetical protein [Clostridia bacterium]
METSSVGSDGAWDAVEALMRERLPEDPTEADYFGLMDEVASLVTAREDYVPDSLRRDRDRVLWRTADGGAYGYEPAVLWRIDTSEPAESFIEIPQTAELQMVPESVDDCRDVALFMPYYGEQDQWRIHDYYAMLDLAEATGGACHFYYQDTATIDALAHCLETCCVVQIATHGSPGGFSILTGEGITERDKDDYHAYNVGKYWHIDGTAVANHISRAPNNFVWIESCSVLANDEMCEPLREKGVEVVFGWSKVSYGWGNRYIRNLFPPLMEGKAMAEAVRIMQKAECDEILNNWTISPEERDYLKNLRYICWNDGHPEHPASIEKAQEVGAAFMVFVSPQDPYPGEENVDKPQNVKSTWKLPLAKSPEIVINARINSIMGHVFNNAEKVSVISGSLPPGVKAGAEEYESSYVAYMGYYACVSGTPTKAGLYKAKLRLSLKGGGTETRDISIFVIKDTEITSEQTVTLEPGVNNTITFSLPVSGKCVSTELVKGELPSGMMLRSDESGQLFITGAPVYGKFAPTYRIILSDGTVIMHTVNINMPFRLSRINKTFSVRQGVESRVPFDINNEADYVLSAQFLGGHLPPGMKWAYSTDTAPYFYGTPTTEGTYTSSFRLTMPDGWTCDYNVNIRVYSSDDKTELYTVNLAGGECKIPLSEYNSILYPSLLYADKAGQISFNKEAGRINLDKIGTYDVGIEKSSGGTVTFKLLSSSTLPQDELHSDYTLKLNSDALGMLTTDGVSQYAHTVQFHLGDYYELYVDGTRVTDKNMQDVLENGIFSFDGGRTLTVNGSCTGTGMQPLIKNGIDDLVIRSDVGCSLTAKGDAIRTSSHLTISGPGSMIINAGKDGVVSEGTLVDFNNVTMRINAAEKGITAQDGYSPHARVIHSNIDIQSGDAAMDGFWSIGLTDCVVTSPVHGETGTVASRVCLIDEDRNVLKNAVISAYNEKYDLYINGIRVTDTNKDDVLCDGVFSFDGEKTLRINGSCECSNGNPAVSSYIEGLTVIAAPNTFLSTSGRTCMSFSGDTTLTGGPLTAEATSRFLSHAIFIDDGYTLNFVDMELKAQGGQRGIDGGSSGTGKLCVNSSDVTASGTVSAFRVPGGIVLSDCELALPEKGKYSESDGQVTDAGGTVAPEARISSYKSFDIYIKGTRINEKNMNDVLGDGVFSFDGDCTLTVRGSCFGKDGVIVNKHPGLVIKAEKNSELKSGSGGDPIFTSESLTMTGPGRLTLVSGCSAAVNATGGAMITIRDAEVFAEGPCGFWGGGSGESLTVEDSSVTINATDASVRDFSGGIELVGCKILSPAGARPKSGSVVKSDGSAAKEITIGFPASVSVSGNTLKCSVFLPGSGEARLIAAWYDDSGRMTGYTLKEHIPRGGTVDETVTVKAGEAGYKLFALDGNAAPIISALTCN